MEKGVETDPRSGLVTTFESLVDLRVLLDCIGWHRTEWRATVAQLNELSVDG